MQRKGIRLVGAVLLVVSTVLVAPIAQAGSVTPLPMTQDQAFVTAAFQDFVGADPTPGQLQGATSTPLTSVAARSKIVRSLSMSAPWIEKTVDQLYLDTLGRPGDPIGVDYWVRQIASGRLSVARVAASFFSSNEYYSGFGKSEDRTWVLDLYTKILGRPGADDPAGVGYWTATAASHGRTVVAYALYQSAESCHDRVASLYQTLLGRDSDLAGWDYWAERITTRGDLALAESLGTSEEYYRRAFGRYVIPETPTGVTTSIGIHQVTVSWDPPTGSPATSSTVTATPGSATCTATGTNSCTVTGLENRTNYTFNVTATNDAGASAPSAATPLVTPSQWGLFLKEPQNPWIPRGITDSGTVFGVSALAGRVEVCPAGCTSPTELSGPPGFEAVGVTAMASSGMVLGGPQGSYSDAPVFVWPSPTEPAIELALPTGIDTLNMEGISSSGVVTGFGYDVQFHRHGLVWPSPTSPASVLAAPADITDVEVAGISSSGLIAGNGYDAGNHITPLVWTTPSAQPTALQVPAGYVNAGVDGVSSTGIVFGFSYSPDGMRHGVVWASPTAAPKVLALPVGGSSVELTGMSSKGAIVGYAPLQPGRGLVYASATAAPTFLPAPNGATNVYPRGISASGVIVGDLLDQNGGSKGMEWADATSAPTETTDLLGYTDVTAHGITSQTYVYGSGVGPDGHHKLLAWFNNGPPAVLDNPDGCTGLDPVGNSVGVAILGSCRDANHGNAIRSFVWSPPWYRTPVELAAPVGYTDIFATGMSGPGYIAGYGIDDSGEHPLIWSSPTATPTVLIVPDGATGVKATGIAFSGVIFGTGTSSDGHPIALAWAMSTATPIILTSPAGFTNVQPSGAAPTGNPSLLLVYGSGLDAAGVPQRLQWTNSSVTASALTEPAGFTDVIMSGASSAGDVYGFGTDPSGHHRELAWFGSSTDPTVITPPPGYSDVNIWGPTSQRGVLYGSLTGPDGKQLAALNFP